MGSEGEAMKVLESGGRLGTPGWAWITPMRGQEGKGKEHEYIGGVFMEVLARESFRLKQEYLFSFLTKLSM